MNTFDKIKEKQYEINKLKDELRTNMSGFQIRLERVEKAGYVAGYTIHLDENQGISDEHISFSVDDWVHLKNSIDSLINKEEK